MVTLREDRKHRARDKDHKAAAAGWSEDDKVRRLTDDYRVPTDV